MYVMKLRDKKAGTIKTLAMKHREYTWISSPNPALIVQFGSRRDAEAFMNEYMDPYDPVQYDLYLVHYKPKGPKGLYSKHNPIKQGKPGAFEYRTVDTSTVKGLKEAERLHRAGWKIIRTGLFLIQFERRKSMKRNPRKFMTGRGKQWQGLDLDLETSLFEYGFVAVQLPDRDYPDEWFVIYDFGNHKQFGTSHIREKELDDLVSGKEWANKEDILQFFKYMDRMGVNTVEQWKAAPMVMKLGDLISYWGTENILGTQYYPINLKDVIRLSFRMEKKYGPQYLL